MAENRVRRSKYTDLVKERAKAIPARKRVQVSAMNRLISSRPQAPRSKQQNSGRTES